MVVTAPAPAAVYTVTGTAPVVAAVTQQVLHFQIYHLVIIRCNYNNTAGCISAPTV
jgi:hypothetical protein